jgi:putative ABC transport system permease protein
MVALGATAGAVAGLHSITVSTQQALLPPSSEEDMVVERSGAQSDSSSSMSLQQLGQVETAPGIAKAEGVLQISPEYVGSLYLHEADTGIPKTVRIRGVEPVALSLHPNLHLVSGRLPQRGERGFVVGRVLLGRFEGLQEGGSLRLGQHDWPILGVFQSGDVDESELLCDRSTVMEEFHHPKLSVTYVKLESPAAGESFVQSVGHVKGLQAIPQAQLRKKRVTLLGMSTYLWTLRGLSLLLALGAIFACINALHGSLQSRVKELATLMALGFGRGSIWLLILDESLIIAGCGALLGLPSVLLALQGRTLLMGTSLFYTVQVPWMSLGVGLGTVAVIGLVGALLAAIQVLRLDALVSLREA